jgi:F-box and WD-40 domain protein CDC4
LAAEDDETQALPNRHRMVPTEAQPGGVASAEGSDVDEDHLSGVSDDDDDDAPSDDGIDSGPAVIRFMGHEQAVRSIAGAGETVVSGSYDCSVRLWNLVSGECVHRLVGHSEKVYAVAYDDEIKRVASGSMDGAVRIWCARFGQCLHLLEGHQNLVGLLGWMRMHYMPSRDLPEYMRNDHSNGMTNASSSSSLPTQSSEATPTHPSLQRSRSQSLMHPASLPPSSSKPIFPHPVLVSAAADATLKIWDPIRGRELNCLMGHRAAITCFQFDENKLVSGSEGSIKLWDMRHQAGTYVRDLMTNIQNAWRIAMDDRRLVVAVQRDDRTWFEVIDYGTMSTSSVSGTPFRPRRA